MGYLLDTCILIWCLENNTKALGKFSTTIIEPENDILVSVASYWEMVIKKTRGKINISGNIFQAVETMGMRWLDITYMHAEQVQHLPQLHKDPFDRMIIAQSIVEKCQLLTTDKQILQYNLSGKR